MMKQPKNPFHPGEILLEEFLTPVGITQTAFAKKLGWTRARLNELIKGKRGITAEAALDLAKALALGADLGGLAGPFLKAANDSAEAVAGLAAEVADELRIILFALDQRDVASLKGTPALRPCP